MCIWKSCNWLTVKLKFNINPRLSDRAVSAFIRTTNEKIILFIFRHFTLKLAFTIKTVYIIINIVNLEIGCFALVKPFFIHQEFYFCCAFAQIFKFRIDNGSFFSSMQPKWNRQEIYHRDQRL